MSVKFNSEILKRIVDEKVNTEDAVLLINELIDKELEKENPDLDYIDECSDALLELQNESVDSNEIKPFEFRKNDEKRNFRLTKTAIKIILVAALLFATTITASAAVKSVTGKGLIESIVIKQSQSAPEKETTTAAETTTRAVKRKRKASRKRKKKYKEKTTASSGFEADIEEITEENAEESADGETTTEKTDAASSDASAENEKTEETTERVVTREASADISYPSDEGE